MLAGGAQDEGLLGGAKVGLLHGRLSGDEKAAALAAFASGDTPVLIATTVVEVRVPLRLFNSSPYPPSLVPPG